MFRKAKISGAGLALTGSAHCKPCNESSLSVYEKGYYTRAYVYIVVEFY